MRVFGNVIDCRWQPSGGLLGPQRFFVMLRPAIIQQDKAVFMSVYASTSNITVAERGSPTGSQTQGRVTEGRLCLCVADKQ